MFILFIRRLFVMQKYVQGVTVTRVYIESLHSSPGNGEEQLKYLTAVKPSESLHSESFLFCYICINEDKALFV